MVESHDEHPEEEHDEHPEEEYVWVLGLAGEDDDDAVRGRFFRRDEARVGRRRVPAQLLRENVEGFVLAMGRAISGIPGTLAGYSIDSIELSAEVSATGTVSLLGTGGAVTGTGGITFSLTRKRAEEVMKTGSLEDEDRAGG